MGVGSFSVVGPRVGSWPGKDPAKGGGGGGLKKGQGGQRQGTGGEGRGMGVGGPGTVAAPTDLSTFRNGGGPVQQWELQAGRCYCSVLTAYWTKVIVPPTPYALERTFAPPSSVRSGRRVVDGWVSEGVRTNPSCGPFSPTSPTREAHQWHSTPSKPSPGSPF